MMGLSIGVHLLNLLTIPAIVMIYYFKRYKVTAWGTFWAFVIGCVITGITQKVVIQYTINGAGSFDVFFVNKLGLPFFSGFIFYFILLAVLIWYGIRIADSDKISTTDFGIWLFLIAIHRYVSLYCSGINWISYCVKLILVGIAACALATIRITLPLKKIHIS